jgi:hypothetical protein
VKVVGVFVRFRAPASGNHHVSLQYSFESWVFDFFSVIVVRSISCYQNSALVTSVHAPYRYRTETRREDALFCMLRERASHIAGGSVRSVVRPIWTPCGLPRMLSMHRVLTSTMLLLVVCRCDNRAKFSGTAGSDGILNLERTTSAWRMAGNM